MSKKHLPDLSPEQAQALNLLQSGENVFLTGGAGSGKTFLVRHFMAGLNIKEFPVLASTGAAAVLMGGRTFHSFFGLGIMEGGPQKTLERISQDHRILKRIEKVEGVVIDEISMIPGAALAVAEEACRIARGSSLPWGGLRVIVVGDFAQLPPVTQSGRPRDWSFLSPVWQQSGFQSCVLSHNQRVKDDRFLDILSDVRRGVVSERVKEYLDSRLREHDEEDFATRLFPRREQAEHLNNRKLEQIPYPETVVDSIYLGLEKHVEILRKNSPIPAQVRLKPEARVMFIQNDMQKRWVNGTRGWVREVGPDRVIVEKDNGREVTVEKSQFSLQDAEGNSIAGVINFPLILAYATTIHKSQGATIDELWVDLKHLWEPGHAYVALSRLPYGDGLRLLDWNFRSIIVDPLVAQLYRNLQ